MTGYTKTYIINSIQVIKKPIRGVRIMTSNNTAVYHRYDDIFVKIKDPGSAMTHFIGAVSAAVAGFFLLNHFVRKGADGVDLVGALVFIVSMIALYTASTVYHSVVVEASVDKMFKKIDHMMIFILIAGTYTPICLTALRDSCGYYLLAAIWGVAALGMIFKYFWVTCPKWMSSVIYIGMGWLCILALPQIVAGMSLKGFLYLLAGGIVYTLGGVIYALKLKVFNEAHPHFGSHEIFHLFVMAGNALQFVAIYNYLL